jgi:hypothetical protein
MRGREATVSETTGTEKIGEGDARDAEGDDPSIAGKPEVTAFGDEAEPEPDEELTGRLEEREQRQQATQQHGDTFAVDSDQPTDTSGVPHGAPNRATAQPEDEPNGERDN